MQLFSLKGVTGLPDNFPIQQKAGLFSQIKLKWMPYKNNLSFCWMEKLSGKPVVIPLYLKISIQQLLH